MPVVSAPLAGPVFSQKPCDSVEVHGSLVACSTYELATDGSKSGAVELYRLPRDGGAPVLVHTSACDAVFDSKWLHGARRSVVLSATSAAGLVVHALDLDGPALRHDFLHRFDASPGVSCLSVDVQPGSTCADLVAATLIVSRSDGKLSTCQVSTLSTGSSSVSALAEWDAHSYGPGCPAEVWCAAWRGGAAAPAGASPVVWSGGDDAKLKGWDTRYVMRALHLASFTTCRFSLPACRDPRRPTFTNAAHGAGVCCIAWHPHLEGVVATGSYDERVRLWDERSTKRPLSEAACGGGVWRLRWDDSAPAAAGTESLLAAACMHGGCRVLRFKHASDATSPSLSSEAATAGDGGLGVGLGDDAGAGGSSSVEPAATLTVEHSFESHGSLAYGIAWLPLESSSPAAVGTQLEPLPVPGSNCFQPAPRQLFDRRGPTRSRTLISCSFYDRSIYTWDIHHS